MCDTPTRIFFLLEGVGILSAALKRVLKSESVLRRAVCIAIAAAWLTQFVRVAALAQRCLFFSRPALTEHCEAKGNDHLNHESIHVLLACAYANNVHRHLCQPFLPALSSHLATVEW